MTKGHVSAISRHRFEIDGTGIRTLIVFSGCSLKCKHCINPYTWNESDKSVSYNAEELLKKISVDGVYFEATYGGVTFGGGEPLLQAEFIAAFINRAPKTWNYFVETSLSVPFENIQLIADKITKFIVDIKSLDEITYQEYTGAKLSLTKNNLIRLKELVGAEKIHIRVPLIKGYVEEHSQKETIAKLKALGFEKIEPFEYKVK